MVTYNTAGVGNTVGYSELDSTIKGGVIPVGGIIPWLKSLTGTPTLPYGFVECDGSVLSDADSVYDGVTIPDLNGDNRFLRGSATSGSVGGSSSHTHDMDPSGSGPSGKIMGGNTTSQYYETTTTAASGQLPDYYEVVYIIRVK